MRSKPTANFLLKKIVSIKIKNVNLLVNFLWLWVGNYLKCGIGHQDKKIYIKKYKIIKGVVHQDKKIYI
jgi:hypothetical protein